MTHPNTTTAQTKRADWTQLEGDALTAHAAALVDEARAAAAAYYDTDSLLLTDAEYDAILDELAAIAAAHPGTDTGGLLDAVAAGASAGGDIAHPTPMLSLGKATEPAELAAFLARLNGAPTVTEAKLDGMAVRAVYRAGELTQVITRGDGHAGEDVTAQARTIAGLPARLPDSIDLDVRGEVFMTDTDFQTANINRTAAGKPAFANPRNATAGTLRAADRTYDAPLSFAAYSADGGPLTARGGHLAAMSILERLGVATAHTRTANALTSTGLTPADTPADVIAALGAARPTLGFPIDGAVVSAEQHADRDRLGADSRAPRWAVAWKYPADAARSILRGIEVTVGRTGRIAYTALIDPVPVAGATISRATLHNAAFITAQNLGIGSIVTVIRAGDVIPRVTAALGEQPDGITPYIPATDCPQCGEPLDTAGMLWRCHTPACSVVNRAVFACERDILDIEGFSEALAEAAVGAGLIDDISDLFALTAEQIAQLPVGDDSRMVGRKVADKIIAQIEKAKTQPLARVVASLSIRGTGRTISRRLANHFRTLEALRAASLEDLTAVEGIGQEKAALIHSGLREMAPVIDRMLERGVRPQEQAPDQSATAEELPFAGKTVVVSGAVPGVTRSEANEWVERLGGRSSGSVSRNTGLLIAGEGSGSKSAKAAELGVEIMEADVFAEMIADHAST